MEPGFTRHRQRGMDTIDGKVTLIRTHPRYPYKGTRTSWFFYHIEVMDDCKGSLRENHPVKHTWCRLNNECITSWDVDSGLPGGVAHWNAIPFWIPPTSNAIHYYRINTLLSLPAQYDWSSEKYHDFAVNALASMTQQVPDIIDLPHLLQDILSMRGLCRQIGAILAKLRNILNVAGFGPFRRKGKTLREIVKALADAHLINQFGIQPLLDELQGLFVSFEPLWSRVKFLQRTQGQVFMARYSESIGFTKPDLMLGTADGTSMGTSKLWMRQCQGEAKYTAVGRIKNQLTGLDRASAGVSSLLASLGGQNAIVFLWDLVPFSFVIDWNYSVDSALKRYFTLNPFGGHLKVLSATSSIKTSANAVITVEGDQLTGGPMKFGTISKGSYERLLGIRADLNWFKPFSVLTPQQLGLLSALVTQRLA